MVPGAICNYGECLREPFLRYASCCAVLFNKHVLIPYPAVAQKCRHGSVCKVSAVGMTSDCQPEGPGFNLRPGRGLNFERPSFATPSIDRDVKPLVYGPPSNYASVPANNNLKSRLVLCCARKYSKCIAQHSSSLDFRLLFAGN